MRPFSLKQILPLTLILLAGTVQAETFSLKPYRAGYTSTYKFLLPIKGKATRELQRLENGEWQLSNRVKSTLIKVDESNRFIMQDGTAKPLQYDYLQSGLARKRKVDLAFDWKQMSASNSGGKEPVHYDIEAGIQDKLSYQLMLRRDLIETGKPGVYTVGDKNRKKEYRFEVLGEERLKTRLGEMDTLKLRRVRASDSKRETVFWLAKNWDYLLVRLDQTEKGRTYSIVVTEAELDGQTVTADFPEE